jgi:hypothetical protein
MEPICPICKKRGVDFKSQKECPQCGSDLEIHALLDRPKRKKSRKPIVSILLVSFLGFLLISFQQGLFFYFINTRQAKEARDLIFDEIKVSRQEMLRIKELVSNQAVKISELEGIIRLNEVKKENPVLSHIFSQGETLWEVAKKYWGDGKLYPVLLDLNPDLNIYKTQPGTKIQVDLNLVSVLKSFEKINIQKGKSHFMGYFVKDGDSYETLGVRFLGDPKKSAYLKKLNGGRTLFSGMELRLPLPY